MSKNPQLDASKEALQKSEEYLAQITQKFLETIDTLEIDRDAKTYLDDMVKQIQHYTYRVALSNQSVKTAEILQSVYLGCSDPTGSKQYWKFNGEKTLTNLKG